MSKRQTKCSLRELLALLFKQQIGKEREQERRIKARAKKTLKRERRRALSTPARLLSPFETRHRVQKSRARATIQLQRARRGDVLLSPWEYALEILTQHLPIAFTERELRTYCVHVVHLGLSTIGQAPVGVQVPDEVGKLMEARARRVKRLGREIAKRDTDEFVAGLVEGLRAKCPAAEVAGLDLPESPPAATHAAPPGGGTQRDVLDKLRAAIALKSRNAKPDDVITTAEIGKKIGRNGLRELEALGEYAGFTKPRPARYAR